MSKQLNIAVLAGDGIGPEITAQAVRALEQLSAEGHFGLNLESAPVGGAGYRASGVPLPEATLTLAKSADAILFGAVTSVLTRCRENCDQNRRFLASERSYLCSRTFGRPPYFLSLQARPR